jgi:aminoglycoside phosphotransferase (APT) family kinase protein
MSSWHFMPTIPGGKRTMPNLSSLPLFAGKTVTKPVLLSQQGFSNENYSFYADKKRYLLRKFKLQDRDRTLEYDVQELAYQYGLAAQPYYLNLEEGFMICEYLEGKHIDKLARAEVSMFVQQLKRLHTLKIDQQALALESNFSAYTKELEEAFDLINNTSVEMVLCHNDLNPQNCIFSKQTIKFIDLEFSTMNDRYFDLAAISVEFQFTVLDEAYMLASYFGRAGWDKKKLDAYKVVYKALCQQWFKDHT